MTYATKKDIVDFMHFFDLDFDEDDINVSHHKAAYALVKSALFDGYIFEEVEDNADQLKFGELNFYMELSGMFQQIENTFGQVRSKQAGQFRTQYDSSTPMFFFAQGDTGKFRNLLTHESWRMIAYHLIDSYLKWYIHDRNINQFSASAMDNTTRGFGWQDELVD